MPKAYWISAYRAIHDNEALAAYAKLAGPAITAAGGRFLARGRADAAHRRRRVRQPRRRPSRL
jgi:uncharacterized protein (DUF1330 family)